MKQMNIYEEANRCLLCLDAPCTKACKTGDPARAIRAIRFDNHKPALRWVANCSDEDLDSAEKACIHYNWPIRIKDMLRSINHDDVPDDSYPPLDIDFCGIHCENPFFLPHRPFVRTMRWLRVHLTPGGQAFSTRRYVYKK